eukprot:3706399-Rhodomonas_salina.1
MDRNARIGAHFGVPAQACGRLLLFPQAVLGHAWPAERVVLGTRVCKQLQVGRDVSGSGKSACTALQNPTQAGNHGPRTKGSRNEAACFLYNFAV